MSNTDKMKAALANKPAPKIIPPQGGSGTAPALPKPEPTSQPKAALANRPSTTPPPSPNGKPAAPAPAKVEPPPPKPKKVPTSRAERLNDRQVKQGRLPDGSAFVAVYHAATTRWTGTLTMNVGGVEQGFADDSSGVWKLMAKLDNQYRKWCRERVAAMEGPK